MQKWNGSISTSDTSDFYRTKVFILKHSYCSKQLTSLCLNSKSKICLKWKWMDPIRFAFNWLRPRGKCILRPILKYFKIYFKTTLICVIWIIFDADTLTPQAFCRTDRSLGAVSFCYLKDVKESFRRSDSDNVIMNQINSYVNGDGGCIIIAKGW